MRKYFYALIALFTSYSTHSIYAQSRSLTESAYTQSVIGISGSPEAACGVFRTMESVRHGFVAGLKGVQVKINQPVCPGQHGSVSLVNASGESWKYRVIEKNGMLVTEGEVGYNRMIGKLNPGAYMIQFMLADGNSFLDEFSVVAGEGLTASVNTGEKISSTVNTALVLKGTCEGATEFTWDFGDGSVVYGESSVEHSFKSPGTYTVTMTANNFDCSASVKCQVTISGPVAQSETED